MVRLPDVGLGLILFAVMILVSQSLVVERNKTVIQTPELHHSSSDKIGIDEISNPAASENGANGVRAKDSPRSHRLSRYIVDPSPIWREKRLRRPARSLLPSRPLGKILRWRDRK
ncbi:uncharacterized protein LOC107040566 isoform X2 [Diachasma alloeum]|uniref:uncharacterized protein LOC107040566 isoform X2 n=1 Tax=Diachasma alloeum TaxID=454923 RepID=UPI0007382ABF|nr:uncharacterized protein LOC107040566 isoform X2 [Diachasma alloeum]